jgi:hypothetical protein
MTGSRLTTESAQATLIVTTASRKQMKLERASRRREDRLEDPEAHAARGRVSDEVRPLLAEAAPVRHMMTDDT